MILKGSFLMFCVFRLNENVSSPSVGAVKAKAPIRGLNFIPTSRDTLLLAQSIRLQLSAQ